MIYPIFFGAMFVTLWIITSIQTYGYSLGYFQREFELIADKHYKDDVRHALLIASLPFIGMLVVRRKHGMMFSRKQRGDNSIKII